jgi:predicted DNA binding CopG/RHH family protein
MPRKLKPIPRFPDEAAEREFWASHDVTDYFDVARSVRVVLPELKPSTETISLRLPARLLADLKVLANRMDVPYQSLLKVYLDERVALELRRGLTGKELAGLVREPEAPYGAAPPGTHRPKGGRRRTKR